METHFSIRSSTMWTSLVAQTVKRLPTMRETWVQSLGWENLLEKEMAAHSSILAWKIPWMEKPGRLQSMGSQKLDTTEQLHFLSFLYSVESSLFNKLRTRALLP